MKMQNGNKKLLKIKFVNKLLIFVFIGLLFNSCNKNSKIVITSKKVVDSMKECDIQKSITLISRHVITSEEDLNNTFYEGCNLLELGVVSLDSSYRVKEYKLNGNGIQIYCLIDIINESNKEYLGTISIEFLKIKKDLLLTNVKVNSFYKNKPIMESIEDKNYDDVNFSTLEFDSTVYDADTVKGM